MYYSIYRIHTDKGTYVGQTCNLLNRMAEHYGCKHEKRRYQVMLVRAIRATPDERLKIEELGYYKISDKKQIYKIEKYWISKCKSKLNIVHRGFPEHCCPLEKSLRIERSTPIPSLCLDMKHQYDIMRLCNKFKNLHIEESHSREITIYL
jgi:hypothetical protein